MTDVLGDAFAHDAWATHEVIGACRNVGPPQLEASLPGTYGDILATLNHLIIWKGAYLRGLTGSAPSWALEEDESHDLDTLDRRVDETARLWDAFLRDAPDADREVILDGGAFHTHAGVVIAQALHHGNAHREQICAILTNLGVTPPDIQAWTYATATGRATETDGNH